MPDTWVWSICFLLDGFSALSSCGGASDRNPTEFCLQRPGPPKLQGLVCDSLLGTCDSKTAVEFSCTPGGCLSSSYWISSPGACGASSCIGYRVLMYCRGQYFEVTSLCDCAS